MAKKFFVILVLLALFAQFLPGGLFPPDSVKAQEPAPAPKISSMLKLQVQAKLQAVKAGGVATALQSSNQTGLFNVLQLQGMRLEDINKQQVFIHLAQKPNQQQIDELKA